MTPEKVGDLTGWYFHTFDQSGDKHPRDIQYQGYIVKRLPESGFGAVYLVQYLSFLTGEPTSARLVRLSEMMTEEGPFSLPGWQFYPDAESMNIEYYKRSKT